MEILKVGKNNFKEAVGRAVEVLASAGVVVVPTDTVYGLAADAGNEKAVRKVFEIKGRVKDKKLPVFVSSLEMLEEVARIEDKKVLDFLKKIWPVSPELEGEGGTGKITCILPAKKGGTIGVRIPNHGLVLKIIEKFGGPITGTSANIAGSHEHTKITELIREFERGFKREFEKEFEESLKSNTFLTIVKKMLLGGACGALGGARCFPDLILDAGDLPPSKPSTVLDCTICPPKILREGAVSKEELEKLQL